MIRQLLTESLLLGWRAARWAVIAAIWGTQSGVEVAARGGSARGRDRRGLAGACVHLRWFRCWRECCSGWRRRWKICADRTCNHALKDSGRSVVARATRVLGVLVVAEMAIALVLLTGAGLMVRSVGDCGMWNPGFNPHNTCDVQNCARRPTMTSEPHGGDERTYRAVSSARFASIRG